MSPGGHSRWSRAAILGATLTGTVESVIPEGILSYDGKKLLAAPAAFGMALPPESSSLQITLVAPDGLQDGCAPEVTLTRSRDSPSWALLAQRSPNCSFSERAVAAQKLGAVALVVVNTVEGIYANRSFGEAKQDYECRNGESFVTSVQAEGGKMAGFPGSKCARQCQSKRCLLTGQRSDAQGLQVCCAWDTMLTMAESDDSPPVGPPVGRALKTLRNALRIIHI